MGDTAMVMKPARSGADATLRGAAILWFVIAMIGQFAFAAYVAAFYGGATVRGDTASWENVLPHGLVTGDVVGNIALASHLLLAFIITVGGPLQLIPWIRAKAPTFHRWNGRTYMVAVLVATLGGLWLIWTRGPRPPVTSIAITINALLIWVFAFMAYRHAAARRIDIHRRWALRLFLAANGVWFFRIGLMFWILLNQGPVGLGENLDGPFAVFLSFAQYVIPLGVLELYLRARDGRGVAPKLGMAAVLVVLSATTAAGVGMAFIGMWLPRM